MADMESNGRRITANVAEVCGSRTIAKPLLPKYQAIQDNDDGPPVLHYLIIERT
jgi:hypothetical protein